MRRTQRESTIELPSFVKLIPFKRKNRLKEPLSLQEEEEYLRTRSFHCLARKLDFAMEETLKELSVPFHDALDRLLQAQQECEEHTLSAETKSTTEASNPPGSNSDDVYDYFLVPDPSKQRFSRHLLPILALHVPPYLLDRQNWIRHLVKANRRNRPRCCTIWLHSNSATNSSWQEDVRRQCFVQEPHLSSSLQSVERKAITPTLLKWAERTNTFDEIVVFLEIDCDFSDSKLQDFVHWLSEKRSNQQLPFNLVLVVPHGNGRQLEIESSSRGNGFRISHVRLSSTDAVVDTFSTNIFVRNNFPIIFPARMTRDLDEAFQEQDKSAIAVVRTLKAYLTQVFSSPWSFLLAEKDCSADDQSRIRWFLEIEKGNALAPLELTRSGKSLQAWLCELQSHRRQGCISMQLDSLLRKHVSKRSVPLLFLPGKRYEGLETPMHEVEKQRAFEFILHHRNCFASDPISDTQSLSKTNELLNELIILCSASVTHLDMIGSVARLHQVWSNHISVFVSSEGSPAGSQIQPRRQFICGLVHGIRVTKELNLVAMVGQMYELIEDRASITNEEWFGIFLNTVAADFSHTDALIMFSYGIFHLKLCGVLKEKTRAINQKAEVQYEKVIVIWCNWG